VLGVICIPSAWEGVTTDKKSEVPMFAKNRHRLWMEYHHKRGKVALVQKCKSVWFEIWYLMMNSSFETVISICDIDSVL
jgi:hypothetical protein